MLSKSNLQIKPLCIPPIKYKQKRIFPYTYTAPYGKFVSFKKKSLSFKLLCNEMTITDHAPFNKSLISYGRTVLPKKMTFLIGNNSRMTFDDHTKKKKKKKRNQVSYS